MTKFPIMLYNTKSTKKALVPPIPPPSSYEDAVGWAAIEAGYKTALRGSRKFTREAVLYDLYSEVNNVRLWRDLKKIEKTRQAGVSEYTPGKYRHRIIVEPKERSLHIPPLRDKIVQLVIHQELQTLFRPVFVNRSFACMYGKGPIRAAFNVQHDMRVARMKWGDEATVIKIDVRKFFYSIDRSVLKQIIAKRFKKLKKKYPREIRGLPPFLQASLQSDRQLAGGRERDSTGEREFSGLRQHLPQRARSILHPLPRCDALHALHGRCRHHSAGQGNRPGVVSKDQGVPPRETAP